MTKKEGASMHWSRRRWLSAGLFGAGGLGLSALATGLPRSVLRDPLGSPRALAQEQPHGRILILSTSASGDPMNGNVPGTYGPGLEQVLHPPTPEMAPTSMELGGQQYTAAKPWAELPPSILERSVFFHHSTYTNSHAHQARVMGLMGHTARREMLVSLLAKAMSTRLQTTQREPISLGASGGGELLTYEGRVLARVRPLALNQALGVPEGPLAFLQELRDRDVDRLHSLYSAYGTPAHRRVLDRFVQTRDEARAIGESLLERLGTVSTDDTEGQVTAAPILAAMGVSPVLTVRIPFGGDNHKDRDLRRESTAHVEGVGHLQRLVESCDALQAEGVLRAEVVVAALNVFGRTMSLERKGYEGRDHNNRHHCTIMIGSPLRGSVIGGIEPITKEFSATAIDPDSGGPIPNGEERGIPFDETFQSMAKTLGAALGVDRPYLDEQIEGGQVIDAALS